MEYCHNVWYGETRIVRLSNGEKSLRTSLLVYVLTRQTYHGDLFIFLLCPTCVLVMDDSRIRNLKSRFFARNQKKMKSRFFPQFLFDFFQC